MKSCSFKISRTSVGAISSVALAMSCSLLITGTALAGVSSAQVDRDINSLSTFAATSTDRLIVSYRDASDAGVIKGAVVQSGRGVDMDALTQRTVALNSALALRGVKANILRQTGTGAHVFKLDKALPLSDLQKIAAALKATDANIAYAEPDRKIYPLSTPYPYDPLSSSQWNLFETTGGIRAPVTAATGGGVVVAVVDTGILPHADLAGQTVAGYDMISDTVVANDGNGRDNDPSDPGDWFSSNECGNSLPGQNSSWHGTHVAGIIAARVSNTIGIAGIAPGAKVQAVRVLGKCGGYTSDIADGTIWASGGIVPGLPANTTPARVINMSLGGAGACDYTLQNAINSARSRGTVVIVAAGNSNQDVNNSHPANCSGVIAVAASNRYGGRSYYSNYGAGITLAAPGGDLLASTSNGILSTLNGGTTTPGADTYQYYQGTSMAAPHVAGVAALMISTEPTATPDQIKAALQRSARPFPGACVQCGSGILDAAAAVTAIEGVMPPSNSVVLTMINLIRRSEVPYTPLTVRVAGNNPSGTVSIYMRNEWTKTVDLFMTIPLANGVAQVSPEGYQHITDRACDCTNYAYALYSGDANNPAARSQNVQVTISGYD